MSSISSVVVEDEDKKATKEGMAPLIGLAFLLIAALILLFMRTISDLLLTLVGLLMSIIWIVGAEGWLGPNGLGLTGPPNSLTAMVPIIVIGLTVDYAIQIVSHYREQRTGGKPVVEAIRSGLANVTVPLTLAAVTTIASLFASLFSPIGIVGDFGIIAGLGAGMSLMVMLTLVPAGRPDYHQPQAGGAGQAGRAPPNLERLARHQPRGGDPRPEQMAIRTLSSTGSALLGSALTTALGLGVLLASPLAASQQFGFTAAITIAYSLIVSVLLVPPAMTILGAYQNMRLRSMVQNWGTELDGAIDAVYRRQEQ